MYIKNITISLKGMILKSYLFLFHVKQKNFQLLKRLSYVWKIKEYKIKIIYNEFRNYGKGGEVYEFYGKIQ